MKSAAFQYHRPASEAEALQMLGSLANARVLAGGQSLMPMLNLRYAMPEHLVDINRIASLAGLRIEPAGHGAAADSLHIGAVTRQQALIDDPVLARRCPVLGEALSHVGHLPTRARGTFGGSLAQLDPASEQPGMAALHDATLRIAGPGGTRELAFADFPQGYMAPDLQPGELLTSIRWTLWPTGHGWAFQEFAHRPGDFAVVGVGVLLMLGADQRISRAALVLVGVGFAPLRPQRVEQALLGQPANAATFAAAAQAVADLTDPMDDAVASAAYRRRLARVLTERTLQQASARALAPTQASA